MKSSVKAILALSAVSIMLTACDAAKTPGEEAPIPTAEAPAQTAEAAAPTAEAPIPTAEAPAPTKEAEASDELPIEVLCPDGTPIKAGDISSINAETELTPDKLTEDNWWSINTTGFVFAAEPSGYNISTFAGNFNPEEVPEYDDITYRRINVGESICGLKLTSADCSFAQSQGFVGGSARLEGTIEVSGWARLAPEDDGYTARGDIEFVIDADSMKLPVIYYWSIEDGALCTRIWSRSSGAESWVNEYPQFYLGNANEESSYDADISMLPSDGSYVRVKLTLDKIECSSYIDFVSTINAVITDIEEL